MSRLHFISGYLQLINFIIESTATTGTKKSLDSAKTNGGDGKYVTQERKRALFPKIGNLRNSRNYK